MDNNASKYDESYYRTHLGENYERNNGWEEIFNKQASDIIKQLNPKTVLDVGCAIGYLVESFRDRGVSAEGIDISDYALSMVRDDIKPYCMKQSVTDNITKKYDLITCIEVLEHLPAGDIAFAIENICNSTNMVIFSSTPFDYNEETHISVHNPEFWAEQFAYNGFFHDVKFDCSFISVQAMLFRRVEKNKIDLIRDYETILFQKHQENVAIRHNLKISKENVEIYKDAYQKHVDMINEELNPKIMELTREINDLSVRKDEEYSKELKEQEEVYVYKLKEQEETYTNKIKEQEEACANKIKEQEEIFANKIKEQEESFESKIKKQEEVCANKIKEQEEVFANKIKEQEEACANKTKEQEETFERIRIKERKLYNESYYDEVKKRQFYEDKYYLFQEEHKALSIYMTENGQMKRTLSLLRETSRNRTISFKSFFRERIRRKKENRYLLKKNRDFWKPVFDVDYYYQQYPDLQKAYGKNDIQLLRHFICYGMDEGRVANDKFDIYVYMTYNPDIVELLRYDIKAYYLHYIMQGLKEGRRASQ